MKRPLPEFTVVSGVINSVESIVPTYGGNDCGGASAKIRLKPERKDPVKLIGIKIVNYQNVVLCMGDQIEAACAPCDDGVYAYAIRNITDGTIYHSLPLLVCQARRCKIGIKLSFIHCLISLYVWLISLVLAPAVADKVLFWLGIAVIMFLMTLLVLLTSNASSSVFEGNAPHLRGDERFLDAAYEKLNLSPEEKPRLVQM